MKKHDDKKKSKASKKEKHMDMHESKEMRLKEKMPKKMMKGCARSR